MTTETILPYFTNPKRSDQYRTVYDVTEFPFISSEHLKKKVEDRKFLISEDLLQDIVLIGDELNVTDEQTPEYIGSTVFQLFFSGATSHATGKNYPSIACIWNGRQFEMTVDLVIYTDSVVLGIGKKV